MEPNRSNIITISILNLVFFLLISTIVTFTSAIATGQDVRNYTVSDTLVTTIMGNANSNINVLDNDTIQLTRNDTLADIQDTDLFDKIDGVVDIIKGVGKLVSLVMKSQFPLASLYSVFVTSTSDPLLMTIGLLFITLWQIALLYNWYKFIFGTSRVNT